MNYQPIEYSLKKNTLKNPLNITPLMKNQPKESPEMLSHTEIATPKPNKHSADINPWTTPSEPSFIC